MVHFFFFLLYSDFILYAILSKLLGSLNLLHVIRRQGAVNLFFVNVCFGLD